MTQTSNWTVTGWHVNGHSWRCPHCGTIIGSNLLGEKPFMAKSQHVCPKFKFEVQADSSGTWAGNGVKFDTKAQAEEAARNLFARWTLVTAWRVVNIETGGIVTHRDWSKQIDKTT